MDCFRLCDIRGVYPDEVHEDLFRRLGREIAFHYAGDGWVLVARDVRLSSSNLQQGLVEGLQLGGAAVLDAGVVPTPVVYHGARRLGVEAAIIVTASHNPPQFNGLKLLLRGYAATSQALRVLKRCSTTSRPVRRGNGVSKVDLLQPYVDDLCAVWLPKLAAVPGLVAIDPGNGTWSGIAKNMLRRLGLSCVAVNDSPDGRFPSRLPDCAACGNLAGLSECVRREQAVVGFAWDGDGDRLAVCDELGRVLGPDERALVLLHEALPVGSADRVLVDVKMSRRLSSEIRRLGGVPVVERSAHCTLEHAMIEQECVFGCEYSGHYFFRDTGGSDDSLHAALMIVSRLGRAGESLSSIVEKLPPIFITPEFRCSSQGLNLDELARHLATAFPNGKIDRRDGVKLETASEWVLIRQSVSEDKISCRLEADSTENLDRLVQRVCRLLAPMAAPLAAALEAWPTNATTALANPA